MGPTNSRFFTILLAQNGFTDEQFLEAPGNCPTLVKLGAQLPVEMFYGKDR